jgi:hypothetical protein
LLIAMRARAHISLGDDEAGRADLDAVQDLVDGLAVPRKSQVMMVMALAYQILEEPLYAHRLASEAVAIAHSRGFRMWELTALSIVAVVTEDEAEAATVRAAAREIAEVLSRSVPEELLETFLERPRIRALLQPVHFTEER